MFLSDEERRQTILACRFCPMCQHVDRVTHLVHRESYAPRGRATMLFGMEKGLVSADAGLAEIMYATINDGLLREWCVGRYDHEELMVDARARMFKAGLAPEEVRQWLASLKNGPAAPQPAELLAQAGVAAQAGAEYLLFAGCTARRGESAALVAAARLFQKAGVPFQVLDDEPCCGWPLYQLGDFDGAAEFSRRAAAAVSGRGARTLVLLDGDCHRMFSTRTRKFGGDLKDLKVEHFVGLLAGWFSSGRLKTSRPLTSRLTYQDPCSLSRYGDEISAARQVIAAIAGQEPLEMAASGKLANCCGAGGMLEVSRPDLSLRAARQRLDEARETGAAVLACGCLRCRDRLSRVEEPGIEVANLVELAARAVEA